MKTNEVIDNLEYLISEVCTDSHFDYIPEIETAIKALKNQEWISVEDRLPEDGQEVLCFCAGNLADVYTWTGEEWEDSYGYYEDGDIISHWMPLPDPPEK